MTIPELSPRARTVIDHMSLGYRQRRNVGESGSLPLKVWGFDSGLSNSELWEDDAVIQELLAAGYLRLLEVHIFTHIPRDHFTGERGEAVRRRNLVPYYHPDFALEAEGRLYEDFSLKQEGQEVFRPELPEPEEPERIVITEEEILAAIEADRKNAEFEKDFREAMAGVTREQLEKISVAIRAAKSTPDSPPVSAGPGTTITLTGESKFDLIGGEGNTFFVRPKRPEVEVIATPEEFDAKFPGKRAFVEQAEQLAVRLQGVTEGLVTAALSSRPSFDDLGMQTAQLWATRSSDSKHKVGACALSNDSHTLVGVGYNGRYPGAPKEERVSQEVGGSEFLHAEQNLLVRARWEHGEKHTLYVTHEPCHECALLILAARHINRVVYASPYAGDGKRRRGSEILKEAGVEVTQWTN